MDKYNHYIFKDFTISCSYCFSHSLYCYGKDHYRYQKYICYKCYYLFT